MKKAKYVILAITAVFAVTLAGCGNKSYSNTNFYGKMAQKSDSGEKPLIFNNVKSEYYYNDELLLKGLFMHMSNNMQ